MFHDIPRENELSADDCSWAETIINHNCHRDILGYVEFLLEGNPWSNQHEIGFGDDTDVL